MTEHQKQAGEVLRLAKVFSEGCGNTVPFGKGPEECPGCAEDFVARVRKAVTAPEPTGSAASLCPHQLAQVKAVVRDGGELASAELVCSECGAPIPGFGVAGYAWAAGQAENPFLRELAFIPEGEVDAVPRTPLPEVKWTGADGAEMGALGDEP